MKILAALFAFTILVPAVAGAAGPQNPADRYDYNMRNKDGTASDPQRATNKDGYVPDAQRQQGKFDPFTQGARDSTAAGLTDSTTTPPPKKHSKSHKKSTKTTPSHSAGSGDTGNPSGSAAAGGSTAPGQ